MTTYSAAEQLEQAQTVIDLHVTATDGRCRACGAWGPCYRRETAVKLFSRFLRLPRRVPGASRPELVGAKRIV